MADPNSTRRLGEEVVATSAAVASRASSSSIRASAMSCSRFSRSLRGSAQQLAHRRRRRGRQRGPVELALEDARPACRTRRSPANSRASGQHLVEHAAERPDVGPLVDRPAARLLRRHVGRGAEDHAELRRGAAERQRRRVRELGLPPPRAAARAPSPARSRAPSPCRRA